MKVHKFTVIVADNEDAGVSAIVRCLNQSSFNVIGNTLIGPKGFTPVVVDAMTEEVATNITSEVLLALMAFPGIKMNLVDQEQNEQN